MNLKLYGLGLLTTFNTSPAGAWTPPVPTPFNLNDNYQSLHLTLAYPSTENWGALTLQGEDAHVLFDALQLHTEAVGDETIWRPDLAKRGPHVECVERQPQDASALFICTFQINYRTGAVLPIKGPGESDPSVPEPAASFASPNLTFSPPTHRAMFRVIADDARALYYTLSISPRFASDPGSAYAYVAVKTAADLQCRESARKADPSQADYSCELGFNYASGNK